MRDCGITVLFYGMKKGKNMKETNVLAEQLRVIATTLLSKHSREILEEAAERLEDIEKIAEFYRKEAQKKGRCKDGLEKLH
jgi:hypothetical protein